MLKCVSRDDETMCLRGIDYWRQQNEPGDHHSSYEIHTSLKNCQEKSLILSVQRYARPPEDPRSRKLTRKDTKDLGSLP